VGLVVMATTAGTGGLDSRQLAYLDWLCTVPSERVPSSKNKYAAGVGVAAETLRNWEKRADFREQWRLRVDTVQMSPERTQGLLDSLYQRGLDGDNKAAETWLRATGRMVPPPLQVQTTRSVAELSDEELDALIASRASAERDGRRSGFAEVVGA